MGYNRVRFDFLTTNLDSGLLDGAFPKDLGAMEDAKDG